MLRLSIGLIKGAVFGGAIGFGLLKLGWTGAIMAYVACAAAGAIVGLVAGRAPWKAETIWTPVVKMVVGAVIGFGLCLLAFKLLPDPTFHVAQLGELHFRSGPILAPLIGILYGIFVEIDDGGKAKEEADKEKKKA
jgi:hypothetical protein